MPSELDLRPAEFVTPWKAPAVCHTVAEAHFSRSSSGTCDPFLLARLITLLSSVAMGALTSVLSEAIKHLLQRKGVHKQVQLDQADGHHLLGVTLE